MQADSGATPFGETPGQLGGATPKKGRSRWDMTPAGAPSATPAMGVGATPMWGATPGTTPLVTPSGMAGMETPTPGQLPKVLLSGAFPGSHRPLHGAVRAVCCVVGTSIDHRPLHQTLAAATVDANLDVTLPTQLPSLACAECRSMAQVGCVLALMADIRWLHVDEWACIKEV